MWGQYKNDDIKNIYTFSKNKRYLIAEENIQYVPIIFNNSKTISI